MARVAAVLPGYASVKRAGEVLHLAPRSVRDLIYAGRLPSVRVGRPHFVHGTDLEAERRRRLGLSAPARAARPARPQASARPQAGARPDAEPAPDGSDVRPGQSPDGGAVHRRGSGLSEAVRRQRATEREAMVSRWAERHHATAPVVPFEVTTASEAGRCTICNHEIRAGRRLVRALPEAAALCLPCGRRALLDWADHRRLEAVAARRLAQDLSVTVLLDDAQGRRAAA